MVSVFCRLRQTEDEGLTLGHVEDGPGHVEPLLSPDDLQAVQQLHGVRSVLGSVQLGPLFLRH